MLVHEVFPFQYRRQESQRVLCHRNLVAVFFLLILNSIFSLFVQWTMSLICNVFTIEVNLMRICMSIPSWPTIQFSNKPSQYVAWAGLGLCYFIRCTYKLPGNWQCVHINIHHLKREKKTKRKYSQKLRWCDSCVSTSSWCDCMWVTRKSSNDGPWTRFWWISMWLRTLKCPTECFHFYPLWSTWIAINYSINSTLTLMIC